VPSAIKSLKVHLYVYFRPTQPKLWAGFGGALVGDLAA